ncbi:hypothetical protein AX14_014224 [Amanita brunnescens Koide BX004]|nr:hypothetical protein AX14_014224 [Amanita brunnescens Koide BX004]
MELQRRSQWIYRQSNESNVQEFLVRMDNGTNLKTARANTGRKELYMLAAKLESKPDPPTMVIVSSLTRSSHRLGRSRLSVSRCASPIGRDQPTVRSSMLSAHRSLQRM